MLPALPGVHAIAVAPCCRAHLHLGVKAQLTGPGYQPEQLTADIVADVVGLTVPVQARQFAGHPGPGRPASQLGGQRERGLPERHAIKNRRNGPPGTGLPVSRSPGSFLFARTISKRAPSRPWTPLSPALGTWSP